MSAAAASGPAVTGGASASIPTHVAIIMDGNGRWATSKGLTRQIGHERGVEALRRTVRAAGDLGVKHLTVYAFSTENWRRPAREINFLFSLLRNYVRQDLKRLNSEGVKITMIGRKDNLPPDVANLIQEAEDTTAENTDFYLNIGFNYGGREEILQAVRKAAAGLSDGSFKSEDISEDVFSKLLYTGGQPDPDILIRTSGERRISNFLLWQAAYAELIFMDLYWPDFTHEDLARAIEIYQSRDRRFGAVKAGPE